MYQQFSWIRRLSQLGTWMTTWFDGVYVGADDLGNRYYRGRKTPKGQREKRWVMYKSEPEASLVPPEWHIWLHHTAHEPLPGTSAFHKKWQKAHMPNPTGSIYAYRPPGHVLEGGKRAKATGDYKPWQPPE
jgi:NADH:ubiquinone oxidoreductase subunit